MAKENKNNKDKPDSRLFRAYACNMTQRVDLGSLYKTIPLVKGTAD